MRNSVLVSGLALFSMFFGAGNVIFPVLLGDFSGTATLWGALGFLLAGVLVPFLGLISMVIYRGNYQEFFGRLGKRTGIWLFAILIALLGPIGSIPRLITVSYATIEPYLFGMPFPIFSGIACAITFLFVYKRGRVIALLGAVLTPILLISLSVLIVKGLIHPPALEDWGRTGIESFGKGIHWGYSLLDMVAAFLYATMVLASFEWAGEKMVSKMGWASLLAGSLLCIVYIGLTYLGAYHGPSVHEATSPETLVRAISLKVIGPWGGLVACGAVGLACLTTAISCTTICSEFLRKDILKGRGGDYLPIGLTLIVAFAFSNLGFMGIARLIGPMLNILHPALIVLCIANICHKLYQFEPIKVPVAGALVLSAGLYFF